MDNIYTDLETEVRFAIHLQIVTQSLYQPYKDIFSCNKMSKPEAQEIRKSALILSQIDLITKSGFESKRHLFSKSITLLLQHFSITWKNPGKTLSLNIPFTDTVRHPLVTSKGL